MEEIKTQDEYNPVSAQGQGELPAGGITANGPPTTLSGTGVDKMVFAQANITRDNTRSVNGALLGERNIFQVSLVFSLPPPGYLWLWFLLWMFNKTSLSLLCSDYR